MACNFVNPLPLRRFRMIIKKLGGNLIYGQYDGESKLFCKGLSSQK